jgi:hypothetical protein
VIVAVTSSVPERADLLEQAAHSVEAQTVSVPHVVEVCDRSERNELENRNAALERADELGAEWYAFCDDDDLWHPHHIEHATRFMGVADVIVSDFIVSGKPDWRGEHWPPWSMLLAHNWFNPSVVVVRASVLGRWDPPAVPPPGDWLDHATWRRMYNDGAVFVTTRQETAIIRYGSWGNESTRLNDEQG